LIEKHERKTKKQRTLTKSSSRSGSCRVGRPWCHHGKYRTHRFRVGSLEIVADLEWGANTIRALGVDGVIGADLASVQLSLVTLLQIEAQTHRACGLRFPRTVHPRALYGTTFVSLM
jgi:hypothetical protein